jgi:hypothetical protein
VVNVHHTLVAQLAVLLLGHRLTLANVRMKMIRKLLLVTNGLTPLMAALNMSVSRMIRVLRTQKMMCAL